MSLLRTALACVLLAVLAHQADAQNMRPATSRQTAYGRSSQPVSARALRSQPPIPTPAAPQDDYSGATATDSWSEAVWTSDEPGTEYQGSEYQGSEYQGSEYAGTEYQGDYDPNAVYDESVPPGYSAPIYDPPGTDMWNSTACAAGGDGSQSGAAAASQSAASAWMGTYRFGGGNASFQGPWYITADAFLLHRTNGNANIPITIDSNTGNTLLSSQTLSFTPRIGTRLMVGYAWSHTTAFEVSYFGLIDSRTQTTVQGAGNLTLPGDLALVATDFFNANQVHTTYNSRLNNAEFNVLRNTGYNPISWLYGFRYLGFNDHLDISSMGSVGTADYTLMTRNNMFGLQGGARWMFNYKNLAVETTVKAGVLENATQQTQNVTDPAFPFPLRNSLEKGANVSFLGEVGLNASYRLTEHWAIRTGYTFIWVDGLALAPNQMDTTFTSTSGTGLNHGGNLILTAINLGAEFHW